MEQESATQLTNDNPAQLLNDSEKSAPMTAEEVDAAVQRYAYQNSDGHVEQPLHWYAQRMRDLHGPPSKPTQEPPPQAPPESPPFIPGFDPSPDDAAEDGHTAAEPEPPSVPEPQPEAPPKQKTAKKSGNAAANHLRSLQDEDRFIQITFEADKGLARLNRFTKKWKYIGDLIRILLHYTDSKNENWVQTHQLREDLGLANTRTNRRRVNDSLRKLRSGLDFGPGYRQVAAFTQYRGKKMIKGKLVSLLTRRWRLEFLNALHAYGRVAVVTDQPLSPAQRGKLGKGIKKGRTKRRRRGARS